MKPRHAALYAGLIAGVVGCGAFCAPSVRAAPPATPAHPAHPAAAPAAPAAPAISAEASAAVAQMSKTLQAQAFSFQAHTIREYPDAKTGELLHVFHTFTLTVRRPDRMLVVGTGDDGARKLIYDGKTLVVSMDDGKKYASVAVPATIDGMMHDAVGKLGVDFPLADLLTADPDKSTLSSSPVLASGYSRIVC